MNCLSSSEVNRGGHVFLVLVLSNHKIPALFTLFYYFNLTPFGFDEFHNSLKIASWFDSSRYQSIRTSCNGKAFPVAGPLWNIIAHRGIHRWPLDSPMSYAIQIKICAEYRDMLPRPRLVCQEPGLRPIGRSPGVPDKSSRGLGSMSRYSAQILICFIAYIFLFLFIPLWVWELCRTAIMHSALCHCPL